MAVFKPTGTSQLIIEVVKPHIKGGKLLDLGCGCGIVAETIKEYVKEVCASDISKEVTDYVSKNNPYFDVRCGNLFECWEGEKFDWISDDVSGVAEDVAKISPWFEGVPCDSGYDGTKLVCEVLKQAPNYLEKSGKLFFPIVSFSDVFKILSEANKNFTIVERLAHKEFPMPKDMYKHKDLLDKLKAEGIIHFSEKFGLVIFYTDVYMAY